MAYDTTEVVVSKIGRNAFYLSLPGMDADDETYNIRLDALRIDFMPKHFAMQIKRTSGADNIVDVTLEGKIYGSTNYEQICQVTDVTGNESAMAFGPTIDYTGASALKVYQQIRVFVTDVGTAGVLTVYVYGVN